MCMCVCYTLVGGWGACVCLLYIPLDENFVCYLVWFASVDNEKTLKCKPSPVMHNIRAGTCTDRQDHVQAMCAESAASHSLAFSSLR